MRTTEGANLHLVFRRPRPGTDSHHRADAHTRWRGRLAVKPPDHPDDLWFGLSAYGPCRPFGLGREDDPGRHGFHTRPNPDQRHTASVSQITRQRCRLSQHLMVGLHECDPMAVHVNLDLTEPLAVEGTDVTPQALNDLLTLVRLPRSPGQVGWVDYAASALAV
jgi:hypothetical protein